MPANRPHADATSVRRRWRSVLFVPANRPELAAKAPRCEPDVVVLDLEDAVPPAEKESARRQASGAAEELRAEVPTYIRVNPPGSGWFEGDVEGLPDDIEGIVVPKLETTGQLELVGQTAPGRCVVAGLETVRGVLDVRQLLEPPIVACYFGAEDYIADLGGTRTETNAEVATARSLVGMAARLAGVAALDIVTLDFHDEDRFLAEAREARALGYSGKLCIHPAQVPLARAAFTPSLEEVDWAGRVLAAFERAGGATIAFEGQMVDEVVAARARSVLAAAMDAR